MDGVVLGHAENGDADKLSVKFPYLLDRTFDLGLDTISAEKPRGDPARFWRMSAVAFACIVVCASALAYYLIHVDPEIGRSVWREFVGGKPPTEAAEVARAAEKKPKGN